MPIPGNVPGKKITESRIFSEDGTALVPDANYEIAHTLGVTPSTVLLTPTTSGVVGYAMLVTKSATSITIKANVSGVVVNWKAIV